MKVPPLLAVLGFAPFVPVLAAGVYWSRVRGARAWLLWWAVAQAAGVVAQWWLGRHGTHNIWVGYVVEPLSGVLVLWALSLWQTGPVARLTIRLVIPAVLAAFVILALAFDSTSAFSRAAQPMLYLVCLGVAAFTLVQRGRVATGELARKDWLWVCAGLVLYYGTGGSLFPLSRLLLGSNLDLFVRAYEFASVVAAVAFLAVAWGIVCPAT